MSLANRAVMGSGFCYLQISATAHSRCSVSRVGGKHPILKPLGELGCQQLPKEGPHTDTGEKVSTLANPVLYLFIISTIGTIKRQLHESLKRYCPTDIYLASDFFNDFVHFGTIRGLS